MNKLSRRSRVAMALGVFCALTGGAFGQTPAAPAPNWMVNCTNSGEAGALVCVMSQSVVLTSNGARLITVTIRRNPGAVQPTMMVTLPLGLFLPAGVRMAIDGAERPALIVQTCEADGCYAGHQIEPEFLAALEGGQEFKFTIQDLQKRDIELTLKLEGFSTAYANLK